MSKCGSWKKKVDEDEKRRRRNEFLEGKDYNLVADALVCFCVLSGHKGGVLHSGVDSPWRLVALRLADKILRRK